MRVIRFAGLLLVGLLAGCGGGGSPDSTSDDVQPLISSSLTPGKLVTTEEGVAVGVADGAVSGPVELDVEPVSVLPTLPPDWATPVGIPYNIGAQQLVDAGTDSPLIVGLPLPDGVDPVNAAIAVLVRASDILDGSGEDQWAILPTQYDAARNLLLATLPVLLPEGRTFTVVSLPPPSDATPSASVFTGGTVSRQLKGQSVETDLVEVQCADAFLRSTYNGCSRDVLNTVAQWFEEAYTRFRNLGFPEPYLRRQDDYVLTSTNSVQVLGTGTYKITVEPCALHRKTDSSGNSYTLGGEYSFKTATLWVCTEETEIEPKRQFTVRHELFHALQAAYSVTRHAVLNGDRPRDWFIEGQAAAAEHSAGLMLRSPDFDQRPIDEKIFVSADYDPQFSADVLEYEAQDFWAYLGERANRGLDLFIPFLQNGPLPQNVNVTLTSGVAGPELSDLATAYWEWAKNQAYEWQYPLETGRETPTSRLPPQRQPCTVDTTGTIYSGQPSDAGDVYDRPQSLTFDPDTNQLLVSGDTTLPVGPPPLGSTWLEINARAGQNDRKVKVSIESEDPDLRYKVYTSSGGTDCQDDETDPAQTIDLVQGAARDFHVLVANTSLSDSLDPSELQITVLQLELTPSLLNLAHSGSTPLAGQFQVWNWTDEEFQYAAQSTIPDLVLTQGAVGTVGGATSVASVGFEVSCLSEGTYVGDIEIAYSDAQGNAVSGPGVEDRVRVIVECSSEPDVELPPPPRCPSLPSYSLETTQYLPNFVVSQESGSAVWVCGPDGYPPDYCGWETTITKIVDGDTLIDNETGFSGSSIGVSRAHVFSNYSCTDSGGLNRAGLSGSTKLYLADGSLWTSLSWTACPECFCPTQDYVSNYIGCCPNRSLETQGGPKYFASTIDTCEGFVGASQP